MSWLAGLWAGEAALWAVCIATWIAEALASRFLLRHRAAAAAARAAACAPRHPPLPTSPHCSASHPGRQALRSHRPGARLRLRCGGWHAGLVVRSAAAAAGVSPSAHLRSVESRERRCRPVPLTVADWWATCVLPMQRRTASRGTSRTANPSCRPGGRACVPLLPPLRRLQHCGWGRPRRSSSTRHVNEDRPPTQLPLLPPPAPPHQLQGLPAGGVGAHPRHAQRLRRRPVLQPVAPVARHGGL